MCGLRNLIGSITPVDQTDVHLAEAKCELEALARFPHQFLVSPLARQFEHCPQRLDLDFLSAKPLFKVFVRHFDTT